MNTLLDFFFRLPVQQGWLGDLISYFRGGGLVMYPLLLISAFMWTLIFERIIAFHRLEFRDMGMDELLRCYREKQRQLEKNGLRQQISFYLQTRRTDDSLLNRRLLDECYLKLVPGIDRHIAVIGVLAMVSPLLGLLGTVTGMMTTFDVISLFGTGNSRALAGGISEALITTQSGLLVSIPGVFAGAVLGLRARRLHERLEESIITLKRVA